MKKATSFPRFGDDQPDIFLIGHSGHGASPLVAIPATLSSNVSRSPEELQWEMTSGFIVLLEATPVQ